ncbi:MAG: OmpA family protein [Bernardetiaceae bacterium]
MHSSKLFVYFLLISLALNFLSSCKSVNNTTKGAVIGGSAGGVLGGVIARKNPAVGVIVGAAVGGTAGAVIGRYMDKQAKKIEDEVEGVEVKRVEEGIDLTFDSGILFGFDSFALQGEAQKNVVKLAQILNEYADTQITIQGHTDDVGSDKYNRTLSEKRANAVRQYLLNNGVASSRIRTEGYGPSAPIADNATPEGRQKNRRVEIVIVANEELKRKAESGQIKE